MALKHTITVTNSFGDTKEFADAYIKITSIVGDQEKIVARWNAFDQKDGKDIGNDQVIFSPNMDSNFIAQAYSHLKVVPKFIGALDC